MKPSPASSARQPPPLSLVWLAASTILIELALARQPASTTVSAPRADIGNQRVGQHLAFTQAEMLGPSESEIEWDMLDLATSDTDGNSHGEVPPPFGCSVGQGRGQR